VIRGAVETFDSPLPLEGDLPFSPGGERYAHLVDRILELAPKHRRVLITSPGNGDGKTVTAANLALAFTARKKSVLLVELAFERPRLASVFGTPPSRLGVASVLAGHCSLDKIVCRRNDNGLNLAMAGLTRSAPDAVAADQFFGQAFDDMLKEAEDSYDWTIYDGPSVGSSPQILELARAVGFTLLVVRKRSPVVRLRRALRRMDDAINLAVLNNR
jgi:Mrp family chromosome partitioning ATPase